MTDKQKSQTIELPRAEFPLTNRAVTDNPFQQSDTSIVWMLGEMHPFIAKLRVVRMYVVPGNCVEIYAAEDGGSSGTRYVIPWQRVRFAEELMDIQRFVDEIRDAESGGDEEEEDGDGAGPSIPAPAVLQPMPPTNGGGVS